MKKEKSDLDKLLDNAKETALLIWYDSKHTDSKQKVIQYYRKEKKRLVKDLAEKDEEIINNAKDYVELFRKYAITSILLLVSLIMNFILIIN